MKSQTFSYFPNSFKRASKRAFKWVFLYVSYGFLAIPIFLGCLGLWVTGKIGFRNFYEKLGFWRGFQDLRALKANQGEEQAFSEHIWIHVSSVGEWQTVVPLLKRLRDSYPTIKIALTYFNEEMSRIARNPSFSSLVHVHAFMSLENPWAIQKWIRYLKIRLFVLVEAEFWPLMLLTIHALNVPIVLVSGILFEREYSRFQALKWLMRPVWQTFHHLAVISDTVANYFQSLGVPREKLSVTGSLKLVEKPMLQNLPKHQKKTLELYGKWLSANKRFVIFLASIHFKEFQKIFIALKPLFEMKHYSFIIAPRLVEEERMKFLRFFNDHDLPFVIKSKLTSSALPTNKLHRYLLLDTLGEAVHFMPRSHGVIMGGSFIPKGGHNVLEPLRLGLPTILGPHHFHIEDSVRNFAEALIVCQIADLEQQILKLENRYGFHNSSERKKYAKNLEKKFKDMAGATERTFHQLSPFLQ